MTGCNHCESDKKPVSHGAKNALWIALAANLVMFFVEVIGSLKADSVSLRADALDFLGDAANYAVTLFVLGMAVTIKAKASMAKGIVMGSFGLWVFGSAIYNLQQGAAPESHTMGVLGILALLTNLSVALILYKYREGDSNMQSVWLCSRNDAIGNIAVILAAVGVYFTGKNIPDVVVASLMAILGLTAAFRVLKLSKQELKSVQAA